MFQLCEAMKWSHLPVAGGIYDQDPALIDGFLIIWHERAEWDKEEEKRREAERKNPRTMGSRARSASKGRRR